MQKYSKDEWKKMKEEKKEQLFNQVNDIVNNFQTSPENIIEYLKFNSKFHQYSNNNTILIYSQNPSASFCASYKAFKDMGYQVLKGQKGMKILVPQILTLWYDENLEQWKKLSEATKTEKERIKNNEYKTKKTTIFGTGTVFDIGQTDCPASDYPKIFDMGFVSAEHNLLYDAVTNYAQNKGIIIEEKFLPSITTRGFYVREYNSITISDKLRDSMKLSVLTHELSHALIHSQPEAAELPVPQKEIEADSLSLMLRSHLGITAVEDVRQDHLKTAYQKYIEWAEENKNNIHCPDLPEILNNVHNTYVNIIEDFNNSINHYLDLHKEVTPPHLSLEEYLGKLGLSSPVDDFMIDKIKLPHGQSKYYEKKMKSDARASSKEYHDKRNAAIKEYQAKVKAGEIIEPTNLERYMKTSAGHPDNASVQAAQRVLEKRGYIQDNEGNWIKNDLKTTDNTKDFSQTIDEFLNGKINPYAQIFVCKTTEAMKICGADDLDVIINQSTLRKIMSTDSSKYKHPHNLDANIVKSIPAELSNPIMILKGSEASSIVLISNLTDEKNQNIIISCRLNSDKSIYEVNQITSIYPKDNIKNYIDKQLRSNNLIGCNKKIANSMLKSLGLQSSKVEASIDYSYIISGTDKIVNSKQKSNIEDIKKKEIYNLLIKNDEFPDKILSDNSLIQWYSLSSQTNSFDLTKNMLKDILNNDMEIVAINNTGNGYILIKLDADFQLNPLNDKVYSTEKEALSAAYSDNSIAKLLDYNEILDSANNQNLKNISAAENLKYPHILIEWSENPVINHENRLSLSDAENLFSDHAKINCAKGAMEKTQFSLVLNSLNTYSFNIRVGDDNEHGIINHIKQHLKEMQNGIPSSKSLKTLHEYLKEHHPDTDDLSHSLYEQMEITDCFNYITN